MCTSLQSLAKTPRPSWITLLLWRGQSSKTHHCIHRSPFPLVSHTPPTQLAKTVWNPKSLSFSWVNERLLWNAPVTKTLQQWKQPREQLEFTLKPYRRPIKLTENNCRFFVGQLCWCHWQDETWDKICWRVVFIPRLFPLFLMVEKMICKDFDNISMSAMHELTNCEPIKCHTRFFSSFL